eukprot:tig00021127_g18740.t1
MGRGRGRHSDGGYGGYGGAHGAGGGRGRGGGRGGRGRGRVSEPIAFLPSRNTLEDDFNMFQLFSPHATRKEARKIAREHAMSRSAPDRQTSPLHQLSALHDARRSPFESSHPERWRSGSRKSGGRGRGRGGLQNGASARGGRSPIGGVAIPFVYGEDGSASVRPRKAGQEEGDEARFFDVPHAPSGPSDAVKRFRQRDAAESPAPGSSSGAEEAGRAGLGAGAGRAPEGAGALAASPRSSHPGLGAPGRGSRGGQASPPPQAAANDAAMRGHKAWLKAAGVGATGTGTLRGFVRASAGFLEQRAASVIMPASASASSSSSSAPPAPPRGQRRRAPGARATRPAAPAPAAADGDWNVVPGAGAWCLDARPAGALPGGPCAGGGGPGALPSPVPMDADPRPPPPRLSRAGARPRPAPRSPPPPERRSGPRGEPARSRARGRGRGRGGRGSATHTRAGFGLEEETLRAGAVVDSDAESLDDALVDDFLQNVDQDWINAVSRFKIGGADEEDEEDEEEEDEEEEEEEEEEAEGRPAKLRAFRQGNLMTRLRGGRGMRRLGSSGIKTRAKRPASAREAKRAKRASEAAEAEAATEAALDEAIGRHGVGPEDEDPLGNLELDPGSSDEEEEEGGSGDEDFESGSEGSGAESGSEGFDEDDEEEDEEEGSGDEEDEEEEDEEGSESGESGSSSSSSGVMYYANLSDEEGGPRGRPARGEAPRDDFLFSTSCPGPSSGRGGLHAGASRSSAMRVTLREGAGGWERHVSGPGGPGRSGAGSSSSSSRPRGFQERLARAQGGARQGRLSGQFFAEDALEDAAEAEAGWRGGRGSRGSGGGGRGSSGSGRGAGRARPPLSPPRRVASRAGLICPRLLLHPQGRPGSRKEKKAAKAERKRRKQARKAGAVVSDLEQVSRVMRDFVSDPRDVSLALPAMSKLLRWHVHQLAELYGLRSRSLGTGGNRYPTLLRTERTRAARPRRSPPRPWARAARAGAALTAAAQVRALLENAAAHLAGARRAEAPSPAPRPARRPKKQPGPGRRAYGTWEPGPAPGPRPRSSGGGGAGADGAASARPSEGLQRADPIEEDNVGHKMLARMGWTSGTGLGAKRQGRTEPIPVVVRSSKRGLRTAADA